MVTAGMPELVVLNDIKYLSDRLQLDKDEKTVRGRAAAGHVAQVRKEFLNELKDCLEDKVRRMDNQLHLRKHKGK
jgi:hypothetical protein